MHKSSIYLPDELKRDLADLATRTGRSEADLIRHAIEGLLAVAGTPAAPAAPAMPAHPRPALIGVGVGPGDPGLVTDRARATLDGADRVLVISTDVRSVGRAEMVVRSVAPTAHVQRVAFAIGGDADARLASLRDVAAKALAALDAGELVAVAVIGDPSQWTLFPDLAAQVRAARPSVHISAEAGITSYQAAAAASGAALGLAGAALVVVDDADDLRRHLKTGTDSVVLYKASTDSSTVKAAATRADRHDAIVAELSGLPGQRLVPLTDTPDGPISYLATVVFPARHPATSPVPA
ncbi:MAG: SAM-dependent methyltransferase [Ilumatobacteraceae bacterium]